MTIETKANLKNILLIDDEVEEAKILLQRLERRGFVGKVAENDEVAFTLLKSESFDCILLDGVFPHTSGFDILQKLRNKYSKIQLPVIMVTSLEKNEEMVKAFNLGANDFVRKPINMDIAIARINAHIELSKLNQQLLQKNEVEAINQIIITYGHEINNPLTIAMGNLKSSFDEMDEANYQKVVVALERIQKIIKDIGRISESGLQTRDYHGNLKFYKVKKW